MGDILFLAHRAPFPPDRGDKIRAFNVLRHLSRRARVHLVAFADDPRDLTPAPGHPALAATRRIVPRAKSNARAAIEALVRREPVSLAAYRDPAMQAAVDEVLASEPIGSIYVFSSAMAQYVPAGRRFVMDFCDVDSAKFAEYAREARGPKRWMYAREAQRLLAFDLAVAERADASLFVSGAEAALFRSLGGGGRMRVIENGIDTSAFDPAGIAPVPASAPLIVFTGQMDYPPNVAAVRWFAEAILPLVRERHSAARFAIVGRTPTAEVLALASRPEVIVTGEVADVRGWLAAAAVVVAPLRIARGIQNKVLEAMAMARPVVVSAAAAEGLDHADTLRSAGDAPAFARSVIALLDDPAAAATLGRAARARVIARYGWDARLAPLEDLLGAAPIACRDAA